MAPAVETSKRQPRDAPSENEANHLQSPLKCFMQTKKMTQGHDHSLTIQPTDLPPNCQ